MARSVQDFTLIPSDTSRNPYYRVWQDLLSVFQLSKLLIFHVIFPLTPLRSGDLCELYPSLANLRDIFLQVLLLVTQVLLLISLPLLVVALWMLPGVVDIVYIIIFMTVTLLVTRLLNGIPSKYCLVGEPIGSKPANEDGELWFYINGIVTGRHWHQSSLSLLAQTFQRSIIGIHNPTSGFLFDLLECIVQRDLDYKTSDIRQGRALLRKAISDPTIKKIVLILHSQGGIGGSSCLDWLFADVHCSVIAKLEIYTFGNAARHFNNPLIVTPGPDGDHAKIDPGARVIKHIEHYANSLEFVANIGVLKFTSQGQQDNSGHAFAGEVFIREGSGHLLNMHYLDTMFTRKSDGTVDENGNDFMNSARLELTQTGGLVVCQPQTQVKKVSRLWGYINGKSQD